MARYTFGKAGSDWLVDVGLLRALTAADGTVTAWDAATGGNRLTDLQTITGTATDAATATRGQYAFKGPDGVRTLWVDGGSGERELVIGAETWLELATLLTTGGVTVPDATTEQAGKVRLASTAADTSRVPLVSLVATMIGALESKLTTGAPGALDTLDELAAALGDDANFAATVTNALAGKQPLDADLTAVAALATQSFGRDFLTLADQAAARTKLGITGEALLTAVAPLLLETIGSDLRLSAPLLKPTFGPLDQGFAGWSFDPAACASQAGTGSQTLIVAKVKAVETRTLTNLWCYVGTVGASLSVAQMAIYDSAGNRLAITADQSTAFTSLGNKKCALAASVDVTAGQTYYLAILQVGSTPAAIARGFSGSAGGVGNVGVEAAPFRFNQLASQTSVPATITLANLVANSIAWWMGMS